MRAGNIIPASTSDSGGIVISLPKVSLVLGWRHCNAASLSVFDIWAVAFYCGPVSLKFGRQQLPVVRRINVTGWHEGVTTCRTRMARMRGECPMGVTPTDHVCSSSDLAAEENGDCSGWRN
ncbi:hypothetical protein H6P81_019266 [Aristolochia fimbriata]|uniref:Uncharacterized protein n=1 Tax=Aristolochia fimbriata TaxID=158543 RepID=A0AAV7DSD7_ARIFI|nr:hypothetical protein H6P81_019266 [Aristolochia fimbriata]